jgi:hypothetical protein
VFINPPVGEPLVITVLQGDSGLNLSTVTAASLTVRRPSGSSDVIWAVTISEQTFQSLKLTHLFVAGDMPNVGFYVVVATLTFPTGPRRMLPRTLQGIDPFLVSAPKQC